MAQTTNPATGQIVNKNKVKQYIVDTLKNNIKTRFTLAFTVTKYFTDVDGVIIAKSAAPAGMQVPYPVYMLGNYDRLGANKLGQKSVPNPLTCFFLTTFTWGLGPAQPFLAFTGLSEMGAKLFAGDIVTIYTDDIANPSCFCWIVQSSQDGAPVASIIGNTESVQDDGKVGQIYVAGVNYFTDNEDQLLNDWTVVKADNTGHYTSVPVHPNLYKTPNYKLNGFVDVDFRFKMTQYIGINFYINHASDTLALRFKVA